MEDVITVSLGEFNKFKNRQPLQICLTLELVKFLVSVFK